MLPEWISDLPALLALAQTKFLPPNGWEAHIELFLRLIHFIAGIIWIGHLYFFNFVNVSLMKALDGPTKGKVIPQLMPRALWWFRWGALITVLAGIFYFIIILHSEPETWVNFGKWFGVVVATFVIIFFLLRQSFPAGKGWILGVIVGLLAIVMAVVLIKLMGHAGLTRSGAMQSISNRALSIAIGGGLGVIMLLNVWGVIWPSQKRLIAWTYDNAEKGTAIPAESAAIARRAFLASRMNTWLSFPMLLFMATAQHYSVCLVS